MMASLVAAYDDGWLIVACGSAGTTTTMTIAAAIPAKFEQNAVTTRHGDVFASSFVAYSQSQTRKGWPKLHLLFDWFASGFRMCDWLAQADRIDG